MKQTSEYSKINDIYMRERQYELHRLKLLEIQKEKHSSSNAFAFKKSIQEPSKDIKARRTTFVEQTKHNDIQKGNNRLLSKLILISQRQHPVYSLQKNEIEDSLLHHRYFFARKKEAIQIQSENERIATRIMSQDATLKKKKFDEQFQAQHKMMRGIRKHEKQQQALTFVKQNFSLGNNPLLTVQFPRADGMVSKQDNSSFNTTQRMRSTTLVNAKKNSSFSTFQTNKEHPHQGNGTADPKFKRTKKSYSFYQSKTTQSPLDTSDNIHHSLDDNRSLEQDTNPSFKQKSQKEFNYATSEHISPGRKLQSCSQENVQTQQNNNNNNNKKKKKLKEMNWNSNTQSSPYCEKIRNETQSQFLWGVQKQEGQKTATKKYRTKKNKILAKISNDSLIIKDHQEGNDSINESNTASAQTSLLNQLIVKDSSIVSPN